jgi:hypothetical protein
MPNNMPVDDSESSPKLRRASNSFKHGLYSRKLTYSTPADQNLYSDILHDYVQHYRPITPDEETLVQQLAALQFRHLKVQTFQADSMRAEVLRQCQNAPAEADGSMPTETAIETRAFEALCETPSFRLYIQELNRLPNKIQRTIERIHLMIRLRPEIASWSTNQPATDPIPEPRNFQEGEQTAQQAETKRELEPLTTKEAFIECYNEALNEPTRQALLYGPRNNPELLAFYRVSGLTEANLRKWVAEAVQEGLIKLPDKTHEKPSESPKAA